VDLSCTMRRCTPNHTGRTRHRNVDRIGLESAVALAHAGMRWSTLRDLEKSDALTARAPIRATLDVRASTSPTMPQPGVCWRLLDDYGAIDVL